jgi:hypothetical protein
LCVIGGRSIKIGQGDLNPMGEVEREPCIRMWRPRRKRGTSVESGTENINQGNSPERQNTMNSEQRGETVTQLSSHWKWLLHFDSVQLGTMTLSFSSVESLQNYIFDNRQYWETPDNYTISEIREDLRV